MTKKSRFQYPPFRIFAGKRFSFQGSADTKRGAVASKKLLQDTGNLVRIVPHYDVYLLYARKGRR